VRRRASLAAGLLALAAALVAAAPASAEFGPIRLVSKSITEQAGEAVAPVISADGRFVAFQGAIEEGRQGIFRIDLQSGEVDPVATGPPGKKLPLSPALAPSISADGRYVSFTTTLALDPLDDTQPNSSDVYVADMSTTPPTYELASAADGSSQAMPGGSEAAPRVALSGDGREVAFVNEGQVYVRDLDTHRTTLVSVRRPAGGAIEPGVPVPGGAVAAGTGVVSAGAALSADGTTVAWLGAHLREQVPLSAEEEASIAGVESSGHVYDEPLWRRVADGPLAPTRRIVGGDSAFQLGSQDSGKNEAFGWLGTAKADGVPQLSADGRTVALIGNPTEAANVFLVDMAPGLSREQAVRQLTAQVPVKPSTEADVVNQEPYVPLNGHVYDVAISPDGREIAFTTARQRFPLAPPNLVGAPPTQLGLTELYVIDLETESLRRVTHGLGGIDEASLAGDESGRDGKGATAPSFGADGRLIAFASIANNLVAGDGNEASDVFLDEDAAAAAAPVLSVSARAQGVAVRPRRRLALSAFSLPDGNVKIVAVAPAAGRLRARASAPLEGRSRPRRLSAGTAPARPNLPAAIVLKLPRRLRHLAHTPEGLYATARVLLHAKTGKPLRGKVQVRFRVHRRQRGGRR
jgi:Tol biopolymer transport system component